MEQKAGNWKTAKISIAFALSIALLFMLLNPCTWGPSTAPQPTPTPGYANYHFETQLEGWAHIGCGATPVVYNNDPAYCALGSAGSAKCGAVFASDCTTYSLYHEYSPNINLDGRTIFAYLYVPAWLADTARSPQGYFTINGYGGSESGGYASLTTTGWNLLSYKLSGPGRTSVYRVLLNVSYNAVSLTAGEFYVDAITYQ